MTRWWPPVGLTAMLLLGWAVGPGPIPIDLWFLRLGHRMGEYRHLFLVFTDWRLLGIVWLAVIVVAVWSVIVAVGIAVLGMFGQAITYHYFTDTVGAALLGTSVVCLAAVATAGRRAAAAAG